jgi:hypothetical protein
MDAAAAQEGSAADLTTPTLKNQTFQTLHHDSKMSVKALHEHELRDEDVPGDDDAPANLVQSTAPNHYSSPSNFDECCLAWHQMQWISFQLALHDSTEILVPATFPAPVSHQAMKECCYLRPSHHQIAAEFAVLESYSCL